MRIAVTAGGTGGHIYPALAVIAELQRGSGVDVRFFGPDDRGERATVEARGIPFEVVPSAGVRGRSPLALTKSIVRLANGLVTGTRKLRRYAPDAVFSTGGYGSFPGSVAARLLRRPLVVYLPDVTPGWAVRAETKLATRIATTTEAALAHLPRNKTVVTGYPVREQFSGSREAARKALGIAADERVLLVAGATQGARAINDVIFEALDALCQRAMVVHVTGERDFDAAGTRRDSLPEGIRARYQPAAYRNDLPTVMLAADLAVMRAGASVLGELPAAGLPAILVPGTYAGGHQMDNARWLAGGGAAQIVEEASLPTLASEVIALLADDTHRRTMAAAARAMARPGAARVIADLIEEVARA